MAPKADSPKHGDDAPTPSPQNAPASANSPAPPRFRRRAVVVGALILASVGVAAVLAPRLAARQEPNETPLRDWGRLTRVQLFLEQPPGNIAPTDCLTRDPEWALPDVRTPSQAWGLFRSAGLDDDDAQALLDRTRCEAGSCRTIPPAAVVEGLGSDARGHLYEQLARSPENPFHAFPFTRPAGEARWSGLASIVGTPLLTRLEWRRGNQVQISDFEVLCRAADTDGERILISETLSRMSAMMAWLTLHEDDPLDPLMRYWSRGARTRDLRPILEAMARVPGGGRLDIMHLLPPFARRRLNTFPQPGDPPRNCFWSALHFFDVTAPPDAVIGEVELRPIIERDYEPVGWDSRGFGDVILFLDRRGGAIHAANHIAGDLVFTKNGYHERRPWALLPLSEVRDIYPETTDLRAFHLRALPSR